MKAIDEHSLHLGRRAFLLNGIVLLTVAVTVNTSSLFADEGQERLRIGLVADLHHADKPSAGTRHYRETLGKIGRGGDPIREGVCDVSVLANSQTVNDVR